MASGRYDFYLGKCLLPVPPEKLQIKIKNENNTVTLMNQGQVNLLKKAGLTDIEFECLIPQVKYPFAVYKKNFKKAYYYLEYFEKLKTRRKPFQFIVSRYTPKGKKLFHTNIRVSLEDYSIIEDAAEGLDVKVKFKLKQYREFGTKEVKIKTKKKKTTASTKKVRETDNSPAPAAAQTYPVQKGDCLWSIAKRFYGDGSQWEKIYNANPGVCGEPYQKGGITYVMIYPGQVLTIPAV